MKKAVLAAGLILLSPGALPSPLNAQSNSPSSANVSTCSGGLRGGGPECAPDRRLLVVVTLNGGQAPPKMLHVVGLGAMAGGAFALSPYKATPADSAIYGVIDVSRGADGSYRIDERTAGAKAGSPDNCHGYTTGSSDDMIFGAMLTLEAQKLVRCVQHARGAPGN